MIKAVFAPGNGGGSVHENWFVYLKKELENMGITVAAKDFPDPMLAREKYWLPFLKNELHADENTIIIGHSSGAIAAMRYAEKNKILGSVLVAPYYTDLGDDSEKESGYFNRPWDWEAIKKNQKFIIQFNSTDDPWIPIKEARFVHEKLDTDYHEFTDQGHFGGDREKPTFPELIAALKKKL